MALVKPLPHPGCQDFLAASRERQAPFTYIELRADYASVEIRRISSGCRPRSRQQAGLDFFCQLRRPCSPVQAFAWPELATMASHRLAGFQDRAVNPDGRRANRFCVNRAASTHGFSETSRPRSGRPGFLSSLGSPCSKPLGKIIPHLFYILIFATISLCLALCVIRLKLKAAGSSWKGRTSRILVIPVSIASSRSKPRPKAPMRGTKCS